MKIKTLIIAFSLLILDSISAQTPFESIGQEAEFLTLTNGKYPEVFENDTLQIIGDVVFNTVTNKIEYFIERDTSYSEATLQPEIVSRWLSRDPLAAKYPSMSPYNYAGNNPVLFIDPDGQKITFGFLSTRENILGFTTMLEKEFAGKVNVTVVDGFLQLHKKDGVEFTDKESTFYNLLSDIIDHPKEVEIDVVSNDSDVETGSFSTSYSDAKGVFFKNVLDIADIQKSSSKTNSAAGIIIHEIFESYLVQAQGVNSGDKFSTFEIVHPLAEENEGYVNNITITGGMSFTKGGTGSAFTNFTYEDGSEGYFEVKYENGNVVDFIEGSGNIDLNQKQKEYDEGE
jgi:hypothetical protein